jgi:hypothetical protein
MVEIKIERLGKSLGFILPRELVRRYGIQPDWRVLLTESADRGYELSFVEKGSAKKTTSSKATKRTTQDK